MTNGSAFSSCQPQTADGYRQSALYVETSSIFRRHPFIQVLHWHVLWHQVPNTNGRISINNINQTDLCTHTKSNHINIDNKLSFNCHISAIAHKVHVRASLILRSFFTRDPAVLTKAFVTYVRPILEYCTPVWSPHTVSNINKIESCQRWFTKRIKGLSNMRYPERLAFLGLETLQARRLKCDLQMCYKVIHNQISVLNC